ncbi:hypothetical protein [Proteiniphilum sp.]|uniref:hypothetical protein n=1 Tax=Proteiniphilum sp. TaxID=1926877 RepID=UPI002B1EC07C|nr:hypothetical protein [Proteiniphilum sp.]MEA4919261.1 hypothetical protein [Proteiniphilum sp.]
MHSVVKSFRTAFVEGRFVPLLAALGVIGMRAALFYGEGLPRIDTWGDNYFWEPIAHLFDYPLISLLASTLSVFLISWLLFLINSRFNLLRSRSNLPFTAPLFLLSLHPYFLVMSGDYISIVFVLLAFFPLLESYQKADSYLCSFRASILIAMASLFQIFAFVLLPLWWIGERSMRGPQVRSFISSLFGLFLVYVTVFSIYWIQDDITRFIRPFFQFVYFSAPEIPMYSILEWGGVLFVGLFFVSNMMFSIRIYIRDKALTLSFMQFVIYLIVFLLILQVIYWKETFFFLLLSLALISYLNAYFYSKTISKNHIYVAYGMLSLMLLLYLSHLLPSVKPLL